MSVKKDWDNILNSSEQIKYEFSLGDKYVKFVKIILVALGIPLLFLYGLGLIFIALGFFLGWYLKKAHSYAFTGKRVLVHKGWLSTHLTCVDFDKITDIKVEQPFLDKVIYKTGTLAINTAGTGQHEIVLSHIENPYEIKKKLDEIMRK